MVATQVTMHGGQFRRVADAMELLRNNPHVDAGYVARNCKRFAETIRRMPAVGTRILDVGSSPEFCLLLGLVAPHLEIVATDHMVWRAGQRPAIAGPEHAGNSSRLLFDCERDRFPLDDNSFDGVLLMEVIEHLVSAPSRCLSEIHRVLRPGGWILVTTPNILSWKHVLRAIEGIDPLEFSSFVSDGCGGGMIQHAKEYTPYEIGDMLRGAGFAGVELRTKTVSEERRLTLREYAVLPLLCASSALLLRHPKHFASRGEKTIAVGWKRRGP